MKEKLGKKTGRPLVVGVSLSLVLAVVYFLSGKLGFKLAFVYPSVTAAWAPSGISLAALLTLGYGVWPGVFLGAFFVNVFTAGNIATSLGIAAGNTLEAVVGSYLVNRYANGRAAFQRPADIFKFVALAALLSTMLSATIGSASLLLGGFAAKASYRGIWWTWWLGDMAGDIVVAPFLILWIDQPWTRWSRENAVEGFLFLITLFSTAAVVFGFVSAPHSLVSGKSLDFLCLLLLFWSAFRFGIKETAASAFLLSSMSIWATARGFGPFVSADPNASLLLLQAFMDVVSVVGIVLASDVSERRRVEAELRTSGAKLELRVQARTEELRKTNEELGLFASMVSHELQEPLRKITMFADLLKNPNRGEKTEAQFYVERMRDASKRMSRLVQDILDLHKASGLAMPLEKVDLNQMFKEIEVNFRVRLDEAGGTLEVAALPAVDANSSQLRRLFENLISNAYKFRRKDKPLKIAVSSRGAGGGLVEISVEDNGIGFDPQFSERIFIPFERLNRKGEYEGSGLGLAICERIVKRHGGSIGVRSALGKGATFVVIFPARAVQANGS